MKILVTTVIDLNREVWEEAYGEESYPDIRASVKNHTRELLEQDFERRGLTATVQVR